MARDYYTFFPFAFSSAYDVRKGQDDTFALFRLGVSSDDRPQANILKIQNVRRNDTASGKPVGNMLVVFILLLLNY